MSLRQVLTIFKIERELNDDETALLNTMRKWTDAERAMFIESLSDKPQKKSSKKSVGKSATKSTRASGMAAQLNKSLQAQRGVTIHNDDGEGCFAFTDDVRCGASADANVHHLTTHPYYHEFHQPASTAASGGGG